MNFKPFPLFLLALAGCQPAPQSVAAPQSASPDKMPAPTLIKTQTILDKYLARPETAYKWQEITDGEFAPGDGDANLRLTSQTWQGKAWTHRLQIFRPQKMKFPDAAILNISYGSGSIADTFIGKSLADATGALVVNVFDVPNQPLFERTEDELIAYTFAKYLETGDETWPLLLPMTKSVTQAMNALQEWSGKKSDANNGAQLIDTRDGENPQKIKRFIVSGASKRGWTTYLAAASDKRIVGAIPIVYNNLDLPKQIAHQHEIWKETSPQIAPYAESGLFEQMQTERGKKLIEMVDPFAIRARLTMPKLLINATNDAYWPLDSLGIYRAALPNPTDLLHVPNAPHSLGDGAINALGSAAAWSVLVLQGQSAPTFDFKVKSGAQVHTFSIQSEAAPQKVRVWFASSPSKDFRNATWKAIELRGQGGKFEVSLADAQIFAAGKYVQAFGEIEISAQPLPLRLSSDLWQSQKTNSAP
ncbi:PhoPQ-activated pathogenicity-related protein [Abditibacterium utsteinense]|uniref:PhoPQ-activated pathogenicity-related protein n=1 Tax=Abditibacterium utsteinense TaxID=1960156 RepID=A0A2S8SQS2_9BACT|nr:PhoPQ-activated protein PqaA family protein [Abditibacterium utsteinense]PQV63140.1 PhoPQ-activated pathogenicity-related protein [Abditibacterium utsteinense]